MCAALTDHSPRPSLQFSAIPTLFGCAASRELALQARSVTILMSHSFGPGDDLIFQIESGYGLLRVLAREGEGNATVWHLLAYEEFFPDVESAEKALTAPENLHVRTSHMALTNRAFERTPAARLGNRPVTTEEMAAYERWTSSDERVVSDRSALLMLGIR